MAVPCGDERLCFANFFKGQDGMGNQNILPMLISRKQLLWSERNVIIAIQILKRSATKSCQESNETRKIKPRVRKNRITVMRMPSLSSDIESRYYYEWIVAKKCRTFTNCLPEVENISTNRRWTTFRNALWSLASGTTAERTKGKYRFRS
jgi:hypothetical protein